MRSPFVLVLVLLVAVWWLWPTDDVPVESDVPEAFAGLRPRLPIPERPEAPAAAAAAPTARPAEVQALLALAESGQYLVHCPIPDGLPPLQFFGSWHTWTPDGVLLFATPEAEGESGLMEADVRPAERPADPTPTQQRAYEQAAADYRRRSLTPAAMLTWTSDDAGTRCDVRAPEPVTIEVTTTFEGEPTEVEAMLLHGPEQWPDGAGTIEHFAGVPYAFGAMALREGERPLLANTTLLVEASGPVEVPLAVAGSVDPREAHAEAAADSASDLDLLESGLQLARTREAEDVLLQWIEQTGEAAERRHDRLETRGEINDEFEAMLRARGL